MIVAAILAQTQYYYKTSYDAWYGLGFVICAICAVGCWYFARESGHSPGWAVFWGIIGSWIALIVYFVWYVKERDRQRMYGPYGGQMYGPNTPYQEPPGTPPPSYGQQVNPPAPPANAAYPMSVGPPNVTQENCASCKSPVVTNSKFCTECGAEIPTISQISGDIYQQNPPPQTSPTYQPYQSHAELLRQQRLQQKQQRLEQQRIRRDERRVEYRERQQQRRAQMEARRAERAAQAKRPGLSNSTGQHDAKSPPKRSQDVGPPDSSKWK